MYSIETTTVHTYQRPSSGITVVAHFFGLLALTLLLVWLLHYRGGLDLDSDNADRVFNVHPFLMFFGFIFTAGEGMMAFKTVAAERRVRKFVHMGVNLIAICLGIVGIHAVFKFHDMKNIADMHSLHSWIGIATFCLFILQWLFGLVLYMFQAASAATRARALPWHVCGGRALLYMAICTAESGLMEEFTFLQLTDQHEARLINCVGLAILLFGVSVDLSLVLGRYA
ncbi:probable transmembrane ascorbate ferrireductase 3 [Malania oleifera]|uniref:probable transmembrane ascorbate ferrireductase 3 n=1 Tax=Malania oleifera TaxID=397392 RepID=UPI0025AE115C|nr:probable transmembrane ascorbate ferrireductase 3 [Malania oleifera]XP_057961516.1 probable transmembrane ascorbate ferrireductase 3 [Malania oleifera]